MSHASGRTLSSSRAVRCRPEPLAGVFTDIDKAFCRLVQIFLCAGFTSFIRRRGRGQKGLPSPPDPRAIRKSPKTVFVGPTRIVIVLDADDVFTGNPNNNCPDPVNNHGIKGWNWGFADGHAEWVTRQKTSHMITNGWMTSGRECPPPS